MKPVEQPLGYAETASMDSISLPPRHSLQETAAHPERENDLVAEKFRILKKLGEGGMGAVYAAEHIVAKNRVALKLMHPHASHGKNAVERFLLEARASAEIDHPGIARVTDAGQTADGRFYLAMELLEGESLSDRVKEGPLSLDQFAAIAFGMLAPLVRAHQRGFIHRDLKPDNIFLAAKDGELSVKLLDFGLVRDTARLGPTQTGYTFGTPEYMAPEQALNAKNTTPASDVWSLGAMLYEMLSQRKAFTGDTANEVMVKVIKEPHRPLAEVAPSVHPLLVSLVERCLQKDPAARPQNAAQVERELRTVLVEMRATSSSGVAPSRSITTLAGIEVIQPASSARRVMRVATLAVIVGVGLVAFARLRNTDTVANSDTANVATDIATPSAMLVRPAVATPSATAAEHPSVAPTMVVEQASAESATAPSRPARMRHNSRNVEPVDEDSYHDCVHRGDNQCALDVLGTRTDSLSRRRRAQLYRNMGRMTEALQLEQRRR